MSGTTTENIPESLGAATNSLVAELKKPIPDIYLVDGLVAAVDQHLRAGSAPTSEEYTDLRWAWQAQGQRELLDFDSHERLKTLAANMSVRLFESTLQALEAEYGTDGHKPGKDAVEYGYSILCDFTCDCFGNEKNDLNGREDCPPWFIVPTEQQYARFLALPAPMTVPAQEDRSRLLSRFEDFIAEGAGSTIFETDGVLPTRS